METDRSNVQKDKTGHWPAGKQVCFGKRRQTGKGENDPEVKKIKS